MEIGQQQIGARDFMTGLDKNSGLSPEWSDRAVWGCGGFKEAKAGGANRNDPTAGAACSIEAGCNRLCDLTGFGMHLVLVDQRRGDAKECAGTDMKGHGQAFNAASLKTGQQCIG